MLKKLRSFFTPLDPVSKQPQLFHIIAWWEARFGRKPKMVSIFEILPSRRSSVIVIRFTVDDLGERYEGVSIRSIENEENFNASQK